MTKRMPKGEGSVYRRKGGRVVGDLLRPGIRPHACLTRTRRYICSCCGDYLPYFVLGKHQIATAYTTSCE